MYEACSTPPLARSIFASRLLAYPAGVLLLLSLSLGIGMQAYVQLDGLDAIDALVSAAMLLGGMGPVNMQVRNAG